MSSLVIASLVKILSTRITPMVLSFAFNGTVTKCSVFNKAQIGSLTFLLTSSVVISKVIPSRTVSARIPALSRKGTLIDLTSLSRRESFLLINLLCALIRSLSVVFSASIFFQILSACSAVSGPMPILPSRFFFLSLTKKSIARLNPSPSWEVTQVRMI